MIILSWLKKFYHSINVKPIEIYLAQAVDHADLEYRMQKIERGDAPFQRGTFNFDSMYRGV